jgi:hypothetical protein
MRIWSKIRIYLGWSKFVSSYVERDKKILKLAVFGVQVAALLIESLMQIAQIYTDLIFYGRTTLIARL